MLRLASTWLVALSTLMASAAASAEWGFNMTRGVTEISRSVYSLHMTIFWICVVIGVIVFSVMFYSMFAHRKSKGAVPSKFHEHLGLEILWTVIPLLILIGMAVPATKVLIKIYDTQDADMDVLITGYQWRWGYEYLGEDVSFMSNLSTSSEEIYNQVEKGENYLLEVDNPLVLPIGQKVRFLITAADVIHSWWVPAFAVKKDAIPGFINEAWTRIDEPGIYRGQCAELCGIDHAYMPIVVIAKEQEDYDAWLAEQKEAAALERELASREWTLPELMERGERVYASACASCHQVNGEGLPPTFPSLVGTEMMLNDIEGHIDVVVNGVRGTSMAAFGNQLSEVEIAAVITYERNAWGNDTGDIITPLQILEFKQAQE
ncbi:MAG: cytochrome c oxidase subunit II [Pseudomonadaceae bacterium]|nr:MAG: cytochrome c oxidase subunit II [Pseudomonadaceae bacterium]